MTMMNNPKWWHRPRPSGFLNFGHDKDGATEYVDTYIRHRMAPTESFKPSEEVRKSEAKVSDKTTFRSHYIPHPLTKREPHAKEVYQPPCTAMEGVSMYAQDYPGHETAPAQITKRKETRSVPAVKFEAHPTYQSDYKRWNLQPRGKYGPDQQYTKPEVKMEQSSTFQQDYIHRYAPPRESAKPPNKAFQSDEPIQSSTVHSLDFVPHAIEARTKREKEKYYPPVVPMDSVTTFRTDYAGTRALPAESMKPSQTQLASKQPLASSSEFRDSFVAWPSIRPQRREPLKYVKPQGEMELLSTQRIDFKTQRGRPASAKKPVVRLKESQPFEGATNYSRDFKKWIVPRTLAKGRQEAIEKGGKFEGLSTTKQHYIQHVGAHPSRSFKPDNKAFLSDTAMDDRTIYKINYIPQSMRSVERYPTPDWLKQQEEIWRRQGLLEKSKPQRGATPRATPAMIHVAA